MSIDDPDADGSETPTPGVPDIEDPRPSTPLTETFRTGTANDPPRPERRADPDSEPVTLTVDGETVVVPPGGTLLDAVEAADSDVPALCHYDRDTEAAEEIGPRTTCRTCMVETDAEGLVAACSTPATDGAVVETDAADAAEARDHNLELVLSNHNLRCTTCGKNGRCELQDTAIEAGISHPRYGVFDDRDAYEPLDPTGAIDIDRNKCILCNRCVEACNDVQVEGVLRIEGTGEETRIGFQSDAETMADSTCVSCGHCATVCPTGSLVEGGLVDATTMPLPGFTQRNSVGSVLESERDRKRERKAAERDAETERSGVARFMSRAKRTAGSAADRALKTGEHFAEDVAAGVFSEGILFGIAKRVGDARLSRLNRTETTCGYCAVGCRFELYSDDERVLGVRATDPDAAPANDFSTCVKGKFGYGFIGRDDRLKTPLIRTEDGEGFKEASWGEALDAVAEGLEGVREKYGPDALACFASSKCTNEEDYLMQKFARAVLGTKNIDNCARLCHSSTVAALLGTVGYGAMSNSIEDVANADCYLFSGTNTTESHPVLATKVKRNVREGADLVVVDPRKVGIAEHADQYLRSKPGYDIAWLNGMANHIIENDLQDAEFIEANVNDFDGLKRKVEPFTPERVEALTDIPAAELIEAAERIATADSVVFGWAMGLTQHSHGTNNVRAMANLALLTGNVGKPNAGLSPFRGHNNVQGGGGDVGTLPNKLPGYQDVTDEAALDRFEDEWGVRPPDEVGLKVTETFEAIHDGDVRGLYVMGENPALSEPDIRHAEEALEQTDFLVVQDLFMTETAEHADVVLPAAAFAEKSGTFTNTERRVQRVRKALDPPGEARQDWEILQSLARRIDHEGDRWPYENPTEIFDELTELMPIYAGMTHERIEREGGIQWPCPDADHPGTRFLYEEGFNFPDGNARFVPADMGEPGELPSETYPLTLTTGRVLYHFHTGTLTRRVEEITDHVPESFVEIHPETAETLDIADGDRVRVESERGHIEVRAQVTDRPGKGVVFVPMHFADGAVNTLTGERYDPTSGIPEYKIASVRVEPVNVNTD